jgi:hypothetical protein
MRSVVVYESMYGNTHHIATAVAAGLGTLSEVAILPVAELGGAVLTGVDLVVVGGPTHAHGISRASTRKAAVDAARSPEKGLTIEPNAAGQGLRDWFDGLGDISVRGAAFDTRVDLPSVLTGRASRAIAKQLRHHGCELIGEPESFLVDKENHLLDGEDERARRWGELLVERINSEAMAGPRLGRLGT